MINANPPIIKDQDKEYSWMGIIANNMYNAPNKIKPIPPIISYFQEIKRMANKKRTGRLCINNPHIVPQNP